MDCEGPCSWLSEELQKYVSRKGTSDLCSGDSVSVRNYVPDVLPERAIHDLTEFS